MKKTSFAFSLLELIFVVALLSFLASILVFSAQISLNHALIKKTALEINTDLHWLAMQSKTINQDSIAFFDQSSYSLNIINDQGQQITLKSRNLTNNIIELNQVKVGFKPSGTAKYAGTIDVKAFDKKHYQITVAVSTGKISLKKI